MAAATGGVIANDARDRKTVKALQNINLDLKPGSRLGLIGHNGSGKTTLLRVMAGIYEPVTGGVDIRGSVAPIFDLGMGMDLEASGMENIRLRSLFIGDGAAPDKALIEEIIEFAELGDFIHMPVRTYSAGMLARLQFAITTSYMPDILLIDEGIGAGDMAFFAKAQQRIYELMSGAGILVLSSHSEALVKKFCDKGLLLEKGTAVAHGSIEDVFAEYKSRAKKS